MTDIVSAAEVYLDENGAGPTRVGLLRPSFIGGRTLAASSFEYDPAYLGKIGAYELSPDLPLTPGRTYTPENAVLFGAFADAAPDEWGQKIV
ncbi:HipA N-terminal domain-containing protein [Leifsonia sp. EB34]|uniref:HipA N-terminal domain-containing protein n=1 Tax=Leifsonia sp. EB34 TaxID=3156303 RepID=UPI0035121685